MQRFCLLLFTCIFGSLHCIAPHIDLHQAKSHIDKQFAAGRVEMDPFPHLVIHNILPQELYDQMQYYWPDSQSFDHPQRVNRHLYVTQGCAEQRTLTSEQKLFWRIFGEVVFGYIKERVAQTLQPFLGWKFPNLSEREINSLKNEIRFFNSRQDSLMEHHYGYNIPIHVDQAYIFAAMLLYCPIDESHSEFGTILYRSKGKEITAEDPSFFHGTLEDLKRGLVPVKTIPYKPNTLLIMLQNPKQWHAADTLSDPNYVRKLYLSNLLLAPELTEKLYQTRIARYDIDYLYYQWESRFLDYQN